MLISKVRNYAKNMYFSFNSETCGKPTFSYDDLHVSLPQVEAHHIKKVTLQAVIYQFLRYTVKSPIIPAL